MLPQGLQGLRPPLGECLSPVLFVPLVLGRLERIEVSAVEDGGDRVDLRSTYEPYRRPDPYAPLWRKLTAKPRAAFEMDPIAWGAFPGSQRVARLCQNGYIQRS